MITDVKKLKNGYKVEEFNSETKKIKKYKISHEELVKKLNDMIDVEDLEKTKTDLIFEEFLYKSAKIEKLGANAILRSCLILTIATILIKVYPVFGTIVFMGAIGSTLISSKKMEHLSKQKGIYDKIKLYCDNIDVCHHIQKTRNYDCFDGSILGIYFNEDFEIESEIIRHKDMIANGEYFIPVGYSSFDNKKVKKLVLKKNEK